MSSESPEERLERFQERAQRFTENLELASQLAVSGNASQRALARQQLPMWMHYVEQWRIALERVEREIAESGEN